MTRRIAIARSESPPVSMARPWFTSHFKRQMPFTRLLCHFALLLTTSTDEHYSLLHPVTHIRFNGGLDGISTGPFNLLRLLLPALALTGSVIICNFVHLRCLFFLARIIPGLVLCFCNELSNFFVVLCIRRSSRGHSLLQNVLMKFSPCLFSVKAG